MKSTNEIAKKKKSFSAKNESFCDCNKKEKANVFLSKKGVENLEKFSDDEVINTNMGNKIHFKCFVPKENAGKEDIDTIITGMEHIGIFNEIK